MTDSKRNGSAVRIARARKPAPPAETPAAPPAAGGYMGIESDDMPDLAAARADWARMPRGLRFLFTLLAACFAIGLPLALLKSCGG